MSIETFVKGLVPSFDSARINEDVEMLREQIKDTVLTPYQQAVLLTKGKRLRSAFAQELEASLHRRLPEYRNLPYLEIVRRIMDYTYQNLALIDTMIPQLFGKDVTKESLTYRKANVLQYLTTARFATKFAVRSFNRILANEAHVALGEKDKVDDFLVPAEKRWIDSNIANFMEAMSALNITPADFGRTIESIPQVVVVESNAAMAAASMGSRALDPLRMGFISARVNLIYRLRKVVAEWQVASIREKQEEKTMLELRLLRLREAYSGKNDPALAQQIEYNEGRLQKLVAELDEIENKY